MLPDIVTASFLALSLVLAFVRTAYESKKSGGGKTEAAHEEVEPAANEPLLIFGAVFALVFYAEMILYVTLVLFGWQTALTTSFAQLLFPFDSQIQWIGILMMAFGYILVFWGLNALEYDKLTTRGPYRYARHPQYLGYFIIFAGFFLTLLNLIALLPLLAIPSMIRQANIEEEFLTRKFGNAYIRYQQETGKFFPRCLHI
jgi:protein-S-isoprenylcysteine O-methyltransferase Ste14